jgi:predicted MFS family arabinose efflux permease
LLALILAWHGTFEQAFLALLAPALAALAVLTIAQRQFPSPRDLETTRAVDLHPQRGAFLLYTVAGAFLAAGFADFALLSYHLSKTHVLSDHLIPVLYAVAMLVAGAASPLLGHAYDRHGIGVTIAAFASAALAAPLIFLGSSWYVLGGVALWGVGMGAQDALLPPIITRIVPPERRATALGTFDACYGAAWFLGSAAMGWLYDRNIAAVAIFSLCVQLIGAPLLGLAARREARDG